MDKSVVNGYVETMYRSIPITDKTDIRVLTSEDKSTKSMLVDIRKYSLYGNTFDDIKRPTRKGIKFKLSNIKEVIVGLLMVAIQCNLLERNVGSYMVDMVKSNVKE